MLSSFRPALVLFIMLSLVTGVIYPLAITGVAQVAFGDKANGSLVNDKSGQPVGSSLIGQEFASGEPKDAAVWFWGRPSATGPVPYTSLNLDKGTGSSGSNLGPTNPALVDNVKARLDALKAADVVVGLVRSGSDRVPIDLVTCSGSGLDPHISPAAADYQVPRVARARKLSENAVREMVLRHTSGRTYGVLGEPVVNVLTLNLELGTVSR